MHARLNNARPRSRVSTNRAECRPNVVTSLKLNDTETVSPRDRTLARGLSQGSLLISRLECVRKLHFYYTGWMRRIWIFIFLLLARECRTSPNTEFMSREKFYANYKSLYVLTFTGNFVRNFNSFVNLHEYE